MKKTEGRFDFKLWPDSIGSPRRVAYSLFSASGSLRLV
jgi:hypothetical protein